MTKDDLKTLNIGDKVWINLYNITGKLVGYHKQNRKYKFYVKFWISDDREVVEKFEMEEIEKYVK